MKRIGYILLLILIIFIAQIIAIHLTYAQNLSKNIEVMQNLQPTTNGYIVRHKYYSLSYIEKHEQAEWVEYWLLKSHIFGKSIRSDDFRADLAVKSGSADLADYRSSGYDRGHLCPAADMKQNNTAMSETFYMSNMSPQVPSFNRGIWKELEEQVRAWAIKYDSLYVVTGPVFIDNIGYIGENRVTIPGYYYKVLYSPKNNIMQAFLLSNKSYIDFDWSKYSISIDSLEILTNINFFVNMDDSIESKMESTNNYSEWIEIFGLEDVNIKYQNESIESVAKQCKGVSKSTGKRCKNMTKNPNGYCYLHQDQCIK